ncbi:MAG TPA: type II secretion system F family protein [Aggregatilineales bacterium]|nr:type II secretion system F family protein [Aggregatilineales bacterium]
MPILIIVAAAVLALGVLAFGIYTIRKDRQAIIDERLGRYTTDYGSQLSELLQIETDDSLQQFTAATIIEDAVNKQLEDRDFAKRWKQQLARADLKITPAEFLGFHVISIIGFFIAGMLVFKTPIFAGPIGVGGFFFPRIYVAMKTGKRTHAFEDQLADNLQMWVNGLRSGYSVLQAIEAIAKEAGEPTKTEFRRVVQEVQLGIALDEALGHMLERMPSEDLDLVITAVNIQREVGGNLAEILEVISHTIRERIKLKGDIRVLTAQGRVTGYVIGGLPVVLLGFLMMVNPDYVSRLFTNRMCGWPMLGCGAGMVAMGIAAIQKIVDIEI